MTYDLPYSDLKLAILQSTPSSSSSDAYYSYYIVCYVLDLVPIFPWARVQLYIITCRSRLGGYRTARSLARWAWLLAS
jgi:hypothetical protein